MQIRFATALAVGALALLARGPVLAQDDDMAMMKKMMEGRPKALKNADKAVMNAKAKLTKAGKYGCCLKHGCDQCVLKMGGCPCGANAAAGKPVCHECKGGWAAGDGAIPGLKADDIKVMPRMGMEMMSKGKAPMGKRVVVKTCPMMGSAVEGAGAGMSLVGNYEVHFCCGGCKPAFDQLSKAEKIKKIQAALATQNAARRS